MTEEEETQKAQEIRKHVNAMIDETFKKLAEIYDYYQEGKKTAQVIDGCRLIFPLYRPQNGKKNEIRISEQELRFAFVDVFQRYCDREELPWFYSIETPTVQKYRFSANKRKIYPQIDQHDGQSANFDFVIHDQDKRHICLIEFKALNPNWHEFHKDFCKLMKDLNSDSYAPYCPYTQRYFIQVLASFNQDTYKNIADKINLNGDNLEEFKKVRPQINIIRYNDDKQDSNTNPHIRFCCYSLYDATDTETKACDITDKILKPQNA